MIVLDASAVLALLFREPGGELVAAHVGEAVLCAVNLAEVMSKLDDRGASAEQKRAVSGQLTPITRPLTAEQAILAGEMRGTTRSLGLSLGDRCCLALAHDLGASLMTADRAWLQLDAETEIKVIR